MTIAKAAHPPPNRGNSSRASRRQLVLAYRRVEVGALRRAVARAARRLCARRAWRPGVHGAPVGSERKESQGAVGCIILTVLLDVIDVRGPRVSMQETVGSVMSQNYWKTALVALGLSAAVCSSSSQAWSSSDLPSEHQGHVVLPGNTRTPPEAPREAASGAIHCLPDMAERLRRTASNDQPDAHLHGPTKSGQSQRRSADLHDLVKETEDPDWQIRWKAVNELGKLKDPRAIPALIRRALCDDNDHPRWRSLWALKAVNRTGSEAIPSLRNVLYSHDAAAVRNAAIGLAFFGQSEGRAELLRGLNDQDAFRRWEVVYSLRQVGSHEVALELASLLEPAREPDVRVRSEATLALGYMGGPGVIPLLVNALRRDKSPQVRWRAAMTLSRVGNASVVQALREIMSTEQDPQVREHVEAALRNVRKRPTPP